MARRVRLSLVAVSLLAGSSLGLACGSSGSGGSNQATGDDGGAEGAAASDAGPGGDAQAEAAGYPAYSPTDVPQVVSAGGPVMKAPKIVPVIFANDDATSPAKLEDFVNKVGATDYWKAATAEYGVGPATGAAPIVLTAADNPPAAMADSDIDTWLSAKLNANDPAFGKPDANTLYALFYPSSVTIYQGGGTGGPPTGDGGAPEGGTGTSDGGTAGSDAGTGGSDAGSGGIPQGASLSCVNFGAYHANVTLDAAHNNMDVAYAVMPRCATDPIEPGIDVVNITTASASHEFAEAASDPFPMTKAAYASVDGPHRYWSRVLGGGENGDMCAQTPSSFTTFAELPYQVQRIWSNKAAMAGGDPCMPLPQGDVYFNSVPQVTDTFSVTGGSGSTTTYKGVKIAVGQSATVPLKLFSSGPTSGDWTVEGIDGQYIRTQDPTQALLKFSFDKTTGHNGDTVNMTINVVAAGRSKTETFLIESKLGGQRFLWAGIVGSM